MAVYLSKMAATMVGPRHRSLTLLFFRPRKNRKIITSSSCGSRPSRDVEQRRRQSITFFVY